MLTLGSLFDGIGVFPYAAERNGILPVWASEIEKYPISITMRHFPNMLHLGDITKLNGKTLPLVDADFDRVICFASFPHFANPVKALKQIHRVLKSAGTLVIAHLLSRDEIARHHAKSTVVLGDELPEEAAMRELMTQTGFCVRRLEDRPGRYLLIATKE